MHIDRNTLQGKLRWPIFGSGRKEIDLQQLKIDDQMNQAEPFFAEMYEQSLTAWREGEAKQQGQPPPVPLTRIRNAFVLDGNVYFPTAQGRKEAARRCRRGEFGPLAATDSSSVRVFFVSAVRGKRSLHIRPFDWEKIEADAGSFLNP
jgi:hypothetical protein